VNFGGVVDALYASGDQNFDDDKQSGFKTDRNYEMGFLLYRQVLAAHTARAVATAGDLTLVGRPTQDLDRYPTRGGASNTIAVFPRLWWRALPGLEVYGGPLLAWTAVNSADPLNSRLAGGTSINALGGTPGRFMGAELDLGLHYKLLVDKHLVNLGLEVGAFLPGSAFDDSAGASLENVYGARAMFGYEL
jgi:hypothetical protein